MHKTTQTKMIAADICAQFDEADQFRIALEEHLATWGPNCGAPLGVYTGHLRLLLRAAWIAEREACARIADEAVGPFPGVGRMVDIAKVAERIRARGTQ